MAKSFARIFFRNAINIGLPIVVSPEASTDAAAGDEMEVDLAAGRITNLTSDKTYSVPPFPERDASDSGSRRTDGVRQADARKKSKQSLKSRKSQQSQQEVETVSGSRGKKSKQSLKSLKSKKFLF